MHSQPVRRKNVLIIIVELIGLTMRYPISKRSFNSNTEN